MSYGGLDIGTSSVKFVVYDIHGNELASSKSSYKLYKDRGYEYEPVEIVNAVKNVIRDCSMKVLYNPIESIGISSMGECYVCLDENDTTLGRPIMYLDSRGREECRELESTIGSERLRLIAGAKPNEQFSIVRMMWMKRHTNYFNRVKKIMLFEDYIGYILTGQRQISESLAARTMAFDISLKKWCNRVFDAAGIDCSLMSPIAKPGCIIGNVRPSLAEELGISNKVIIVNGGHDQFCAPLGSGVTDSSICSNGMGSSDALHCILTQRLSAGFANKYDYSESPYLKDGTYFTFGSVLASGSMLRWYQETFEQAMEVRLKDKCISFYDYMESIIGSEPSGIITIPAFSGTGTPIYSTHTKGMVYGLQLTTTEGQFYRSLLEGVAYFQLLNMEILESQGISIKTVNATGGGSLSCTWMQIRADVFGKECKVMGSNSCARAAALLGAVACGAFGDVSEAVAALIKPEKCYYPNPSRRKEYLEFYEQFKELLRKNYEGYKE